MPWYPLGNGRGWFPHTGRIIGRVRQAGGAGAPKDDLAATLAAADAILAAVEQGRAVDHTDVVAARRAVERARARLEETTWD